MSEVGGGELTQGSEMESQEVFDDVDELNLHDLRIGDKFVVTTGKLPDLVKSVYTVNVTGVRKDGLRVAVRDDITRKGITSVDEFTARLVGEHVKTEAADPNVGMRFETVKYQRNEYGISRAKAHRVVQIQSIALRRRQ